MPCGPGSKTLKGITLPDQPPRVEPTRTPPPAAPTGIPATPPAARPMSDQERAEALLQIKAMQFQLEDLIQSRNSGENDMAQREVSAAEQAILDRAAATQQAESEKTKRVGEIMAKEPGTLTADERKFLAAEALAVLRGL